MWIYSQSTGTLTDRFGAVLGQGYSGNGASLDLPSAQGIIGHGPIPQGMWTIGKFETYPHLGEVVAPLLPCPGNTMDGREGGFFIHGDNQAMNHTASDGCLIFSRVIREAVSESGDTSLQVVA